ncbi:MAG: hypothetical protein R3E67_02345 [Pseudomonadales bacterium]
MQIVRNEHFSTQSDANRIHIDGPGLARGVIQDLEGTVLAQSKPSFTLEIIKERGAHRLHTARELQNILVIG